MRGTIGIERRIEQLLRSKGSGLESFDDGSGPDFAAVTRHIAARLEAAARRQAGREKKVESFRVSRMTEAAGETSATAMMEAERLTGLARVGIAQVKNGAAPGSLSADVQVALEAVISVTDRPSIPVKDGAVAFPDPPLPPSIEFWLTVLQGARDRIRPAARGTGALLFEDEQGVAGGKGTVWRVGPNFLVTNRHVAAAAMRFDPMTPPDDPLLGLRPFPGRSLVADFSREDGAVPNRFVIDALVYIEPEGRHDMAVFRLKPGPAPPAKLILAGRGAPATPASNVFVVGHPAADNLQDVDAVAEVFGTLDGSKRLSPGKVMQGSVDDLLLHDCSTVGGSSGSPVIEVVSGKVIGLHYFGETRQHNEAVFIPALPDEHFLFQLG